MGVRGEPTAEDVAKFEESFRTSTMLGFVRSVSGLSASIVNGVPCITLMFKVRSPEHAERGQEKIVTYHVVFPLYDNGSVVLSLGEELIAAVEALLAARAPKI